MIIFPHQQDERLRELLTWQLPSILEGLTQSGAPEG